MRQRRLRAAVLGLVSFLFVGIAAAEPPLKFERSIPLAIEGRIDHMTFDAKGRRLFVAALGNGSVEVVDLKAGRVVHSLKGFQEPQGVQFLDDSGTLAVADGGDGSVRFFDAKSVKPLKTLSLGDDADNMRYDAAAKRLFVGFGRGALAVVDPAAVAPMEAIELGTGHPESFQLERRGPRVFVNVPPAREIVVADRRKRVVIARWKLDAGANFAMTLDEVHGRLFAASRAPARLQVFETSSGIKKADEPLCADSDDIFYDAARRRVYASCGEGVIEVFAQEDADHYRLVTKVATAAGARTSFFAPELGLLFLAVPHRGAQRAELRIYEIRP